MARSNLNSEIKINLAFQADTSQAKKEIKTLQDSLQNLAKKPSNLGEAFDSKKLTDASKAAQELQIHLQKALNVNTGKIDLSRFSSSMKTAGNTLQDYQEKLKRIGPEGAQAFSQLASAIAQSEAPVVNLGSKVTGLLETFKTALRYQISSAVIQTIGTSISDAYHYAQDLNESLNNIQIVTGRSAEEMAQFAESANASAKSLSSTTVDYTDAALIYYQQGLSDEEVKERTDVTIKMANVARESATEVSNYMTAIWNNFDDGSRSLEHYADVMTNLGANTASSTAEIAAGVEKFASVTRTIGLSYDYATTALATVVDKTRESADVVGTAYKTLFSRIEGLELGRTLDDGTTLNKYSNNLRKVGINIKDELGNLKDMDTILDEMGDKWGDLSKDQKIALAQGVAGVRQYTQLVALMDNWDAFQENLNIARTADGTLNQQAEIYAQGWEAAQKRVQASLEDIYHDLVNEDFFIGLLNILEKALDGIDGFIEGLGGIEGVLLKVGGVFASVFAYKVPDMLSSLRQNFAVLTGQASKEAAQMRQDAIAIMGKEATDPSNSQAMQLKAAHQKELLELQDQYANNVNHMSDAEAAFARSQLETVAAINAENDAIHAQEEALKNEIAVKSGAVQNDVKTQTDSLLGTQGLGTAIKNTEVMKAADEESAAWNKASESVNNYIQKLEEMSAQLVLVNTFNEEGIWTPHDERAEDAAILAQERSEDINANLYNINDDGSIDFQRQEIAKLIHDYQEMNQAEIEAYNESNRQFHELSAIQESLIAQGNTWTQEQEEGLYKDATAADQLKTNMQTYLNLLTGKSNALNFNLPDEELNRFKEALNTADPEQWTKAFQDLVAATTLGGKDFENELIKIREAAAQAAREAAQAEGQAVIEEEAQKAAQEAANKVRATSKKHNSRKIDKEARRAAREAEQQARAEAQQRIQEEAERRAEEAAAQAEAQARNRALVNRIEEEQNKSGFHGDNIKNNIEVIGGATSQYHELTGAVERYGRALEKTSAEDEKHAKLLASIKEKMAGAQVSFGTVATQVAGAGMTLASTIASMSSAWKTLNSDTASGLEKTVAATTALSSSIMALKTVKETYAIVTEFATQKQVAETIALISSAGPVGVLTAAMGALNTVMLANPVLAVVAGLAALTAGIFAVTKALDHFAGASPKEQFDEAKTSAEDLSNSLNSVRTEAQNVASAFDRYDSAVDKLNNCTKGTQEWRDALLDVNDAASSILTDFPEIGQIEGAVEYDERTHTNRITEKGRQEYENRLADRENSASIAATIGQDKLNVASGTVNLLDSDIPSQIIDFAEKLDLSSVDNLNASLVKLDDTLTADQRASIATEENLSALKSYVDSLKNFDLSYQNEAVSALNATGKQYDDKALDAAGAILKDNIESILGDIETGVAKIDYNAIAKQYGYNDLKSTADGGYTYLDKNNEEQKVTSQDAAIQYAALSGKDEMITSIATLSDWITQLSSKTDVVSQAVTSLATGNGYTGLQKEQFDEFAKLVQSKNDNPNGQIDGETLKQVIDIDDWQKTADMLGVSLEDMLDTAVQSFQDYAEKVEESAQQTFAKNIVLSDSTVNTIEKQKEQAATNGGDALTAQQNVNFIDDFYNAAVSHMQNGLQATDAEIAKEVDNVASAIASVSDWRSVGIQELHDIFAEAGVQTEYTTQSFENLIAVMLDAPKAIYEITSATELMEMELGKLSKKGTIKDDDFEGSLLEKNFGDMFIDLKNGTHMLIGSIDNLKDVMHDRVQNDLFQQAQQVQRQNDNLDKQVAATNRYFDPDKLSNTATSQEDLIYGQEEQQQALSKMSSREALKESQINSNENSFDTAYVTRQLEALRAANIESESFNNSLLAWEEKLKQGANFSTRDLQEISQAVRNHKDDIIAATNEANKALEAQKAENADTQQGYYNAMMANSDNTNDIDTVNANVSAMGGSVDPEVQGQALVNMAGSYESCTDEIQKYNEAMAGTDLAQQAAARSALEVGVRAAEDAAQWKLNAEQVENVADAYAQMGHEGSEGWEDFKEMLDSADTVEKVAQAESALAEAAADAATRNLRLNEGVADIAKNYETYADVLEAVQAATDDVGQATLALADGAGPKLVESLADILDISEDMINADLVEAIDPDTFLAAANGDENAINDIRDAFIDAQIAALNLTDEMIDGVPVAEGLKNELAGLAEGALIDFDNTPFLNKLIEAEVAAGSSATEIESLLSGLGIDCDVEPLNMSFEEAKAMARDTGDYIVDAASTNAEVETKTAESTDTKEDVSFNEELHENPHTQLNTVLQSDIEPGETPHAVPVTTVYWETDKSVTSEPLQEETKTETTGQAIKISNAHKSAGGHVSTNHQGTARTAAPRRARGGRRKAARRRRRRARRAARKRTEDKLDYKDEKERYHVIRGELEQIQDKLETVDKVKNRAFGKSKMKAMDNEAALLKQNIKLQKNYISEIKAYLKTDKKRMESYGAKFDKDGVIQNYDALVKTEVEAYNKAINKYNKSKQKDADEKALEKAKERYKKFQEDLKQYEETLKLLDEQQQTLQDLANQQYDLRVQKINYVVEMQIDIDQSGLDLLDLKLKSIGDTALHTADKIALLGKKAQYYLGGSKSADGKKSGLDSIIDVSRKQLISIMSRDPDAYKVAQKIDAQAASAGNAAKNGAPVTEPAKRDKNGNLLFDSSYTTTEKEREIFSKADFTEEEINSMKAALEQMQSAVEELIQIREQVFDSLSESFNDLVGNIDRAIEKIEAFQKVTQTYQNITDIVGKQVVDADGKLANALSKTAYQQSIIRAKAVKEEYKAVSDEIPKLQAEYERSLAAGHEYEAKRWKEMLDEATDKQSQLYSDWYDAWEDTFNKANDAFETGLTTSVDNFENALVSSIKIMNEAGQAVGQQFHSLSDMAEAFNRTNTLQDLHVDDYEKIYRLSKLTRDINKSVEKSNSVASKKALLALEKQIAEIQNSEAEMSQYDLDYLRKRYELLLAEQQLKDAGEAKSKVTMRQDSEGNWGYVYTADDSKVKDAEQNYEDKLYEMQKLNDDYINDLQDKIVSTEQEMADALRDIRASDYANYEEYKNAVDQTTTYYQNLLNGYYDELDSALTNQKYVYENDWGNYSAATGYKISENEKFTDSFDETTLSMVTGCQSVEQAQNDLNEAIKTFKTVSSANYKDWRKNVQDAMKLGKTSIENFAADSYKKLCDPTNPNSIIKQTEAAGAAAEAMAKKFKTEFDQVITDVSTWEQQFSGKINDAIITVGKLTEAYNEMIQKKAQADVEKETKKNDEAAGIKTGLTDGKKDTKSEPAKDTKSEPAKDTQRTLRKGDRVKLKSGRFMHSTPYTREQGGRHSDTKRGKLCSAAPAGVEATVIDLNSSGGHGVKIQFKRAYGNDAVQKKEWWVSQNSLVGYDTGGYTGSWGEEGRLALLHQKEIILNASDTTNFLSALEIVRNIAKTIDLNAAASMSSMSGILAAGLNNFNTSQSQVQQEVTIHAEFPAVQNRSEIEQAFDNLINKASQFANRK